MLAVAFAGAAATVIAVLGVVQVNETRAVGSNLAQAEIEQLRARPYDEVVAPLAGGGGPVSTVSERELDGRSYVIETTVAFTTLDVEVSACAVDSGDVTEQVVQVDLAVWPASEPQRRSTSSTVIARLPDELPAGQGNLAVYVTDEQEPPQPVDSVVVTLRHGATDAFVEAHHTGPEGCVLFAGAAEGNYNVQVERVDYVGPRPSSNEQAPIREGSVVAGTTTIVEFRYAWSGSFDPVTARAPASSATILPDELEVRVARMGRTKLGSLGTVIDPVWPGDWQAWAGSCPDADPEALTDTTQPRWPGASRQPRIVAAPAVSTPLEVHLAAVELRDGGGGGGGGQPVFTGLTSITASAADCDEGQHTLSFTALVPAMDGYDTAQGPVRIGLPYGVWDLTIVSTPGQGQGQGAPVSREVSGIVVAPPVAEPEILVVEVPR